MNVVFDAGVVFAGAGWRGEAHRCLVAMARRRVTAFATEQTLEELRELVAERGIVMRHSAGGILDWYFDRVKRIGAAPLGKQRSRDANDDPYLACALGAQARAVVTRDQDLLALGKPFGIAMITPRELLAKLAGQPSESKRFR